MLVAVKGYYNGNYVDINEKDRTNFVTGDEVIVTASSKNNKTDMSLIEKRKKILESEMFVVPTDRSVEEVEKEIRSGRSDRF